MLSLQEYDLSSKTDFGTSKIDENIPKNKRKYFRMPLCQNHFPLSSYYILLLSSE